MHFVNLTLEEYEKISEKHEHSSFMQSKEQYLWKQKEGNNCYIVGVKEDNEIIAATFLYGIPVMRMFTYFYSPRGFLLDYDKEEVVTFFIKHLKEYLKKKKGLYLKFDPYVPYKERDLEGKLVEKGFDHSNVVELLKKECIHGGFTIGVNEISQARWMMVLDLENETEQSLLKNMDQQTRWSINKTIKQGIKVRELSIDELDIFIDMLEKTAKRRNFATRSREYYKQQFLEFGSKAEVLLAYLDVEDFKERALQEKQTLTEELNQIQKKLDEMPNSKKFIKKLKVCNAALELNHKKIFQADQLEAEYGKVIPMASSFFIIHGSSCVYLYSASDERFSKYNAPYAIQWYMIRESLSKGLKCYNFYGTSGNFTAEADDYGVYEFKKGFNAHAVELIGDFYLPIRKNIFKLYNKIKHVV